MGTIQAELVAARDHHAAVTASGTATWETIIEAIRRLHRAEVAALAQTTRKMREAARRGGVM